MLLTYSTWMRARSIIMSKTNKTHQNTYFMSAFIKKILEKTNL